MGWDYAAGQASRAYWLKNRSTLWCGCGSAGIPKGVESDIFENTIWECAPCGRGSVGGGKLGEDTLENITGGRIWLVGRRHLHFRGIRDDANSATAPCGHGSVGQVDMSVTRVNQRHAWTRAPPSAHALDPFFITFGEPQAQDSPFCRLGDALPAVAARWVVESWAKTRVSSRHA